MLWHLIIEKIVIFQIQQETFKYAKDIRLFKMQEFIQNMWNDINTIYYAACKKHHSKWIMCEAKEYA